VRILLKKESQEPLREIDGSYSSADLMRALL
jgi:hypothetical protein